MTYTDQGQVESDPHLVTSSPPPLPPRTASLDPQADSERQTCLTHTPTSLARCRYAEMHSWPQTQLCLVAHPEPPRQPCSQTHTQRWSHLWREILIVTHRSTTSWGLADTIYTDGHTIPHTDLPSTHKPQMWVQVNSIMVVSETTLALPTHSFNQSTNVF
ncbi:unnamed protein product [Rangifer tarandus platyrhynchus]|uniref:Uncharacterized protein n=1 Tax=Rangifer tarandus platyrhynchus TaxID=3082113 RepID=A0AC59ZI41_RANTA